LGAPEHPPSTPLAKKIEVLLPGLVSGFFKALVDEMKCLWNDTPNTLLLRIYEAADDFILAVGVVGVGEKVWKSLFQHGVLFQNWRK
jgi:hypothetical protein